MVEEKGIKELTDVIDAALAIEGLVVSVAADGRVDLTDLPKIFAAMPELVAKLPAAIDGVSNIPGEIKDLSAEELEMCAAHVMSKLAVQNEKAIAIVDAALKLVFSVASLVKAIKK